MIYYDKPGCGPSDRERPALSLAEQVATLAALVDELGLGRFALFGFSQGGPVGAAYAAEHPERVAQLLLFSTQARTPPPADPAQAAAVWEATKGLIRAHWGLGSSVLAEVQVPGADAALREWFARMMRESVDAETAIAMLERFRACDVTPLLGRVQVPTLVLHRRGDQVFPYERGRELAAAKSNPEIAAWLVLSPHTVVRHVSNILQKTGLHNRLELATYAARRQLFE